MNFSWNEKYTHRVLQVEAMADRVRECRVATRVASCSGIPVAVGRSKNCIVSSRRSTFCEVCPHLLMVVALTEKPQGERTLAAF